MSGSDKRVLLWLDCSDATYIEQSFNRKKILGVTRKVGENQWRWVGNPKECTQDHLSKFLETCSHAAKKQHLLECHHKIWTIGKKKEDEELEQLMLEAHGQDLKFAQTHR